MGGKEGGIIFMVNRIFWVFGGDGIGGFGRLIGRYEGRRNSGRGNNFSKGLEVVWVFGILEIVR